MKLRGKVALITGSAMRVGQELAMRLSEEGCNIVVHYGRSAKAAVETVAKLESNGVKAWKVCTDLSDESAVKQLIPEAVACAGQIDILINNASVFPTESFTTADSANWDSTMMINLKTPFLLSQAFASQLPEGNQGKIINLLDASAMRPRDHHFAYTISKYGLEGLTETIAHALAPRNIQVNGIALGAILPNSTDADPAAFESMAANNPSRRNGDPIAVCNAMVYLLRHADYVTGESIRVNGGQHLV